ncbi:TrmB family transcriptional regulator [Halonotius terrestris]|uniref:TrmB family transcriptional regulator n=1 Tax=Halonotius terrestris TaxID=2487750 RepID=A0A8J8PAX9_9EURY|nr:TrmB family transcriptional regulator [Halonotius terrestris]TQQ79885.1 TrmB family transcriptional regulator [Halonotius terrestris]
MIAETAAQISLPGELQSPRAKLVYLFLSMNGTVTISELQNGLDMKKISLYSVLKCLEKEDLITKNGDSYALA